MRVKGSNREDSIVLDRIPVSFTHETTQPISGHPQVIIAKRTSQYALDPLPNFSARKGRRPASSFENDTAPKRSPSVQP